MPTSPLPALLLAATPTISAPGAPTPIVGGEPTAPGEFDAVVGLRIGAFQCSGTLISASHVLTAAHCVADLPPGSPIDVFFGPRDEPGMQVPAASFAVFPGFCAPSDGCDEDLQDLAVVELSSSLSVADIPPILWKQSEWDATMKKGTPLTLVGFGRTEAGAVGEKRKVQVELDWLTDSGLEFFAGGDGKDSCDGDSGGPAFVRMPDGSYRLAGVLSRGSVPCGEGGIYGIPYVATCWIRETYQLDLTEGYCGTCQCLDTSQIDEGCSCTTRQRPAPPFPALAPLFALVVLRTGRRRRRSP